MRKLTLSLESCKAWINRNGFQNDSFRSPDPAASHCHVDVPRDFRKTDAFLSSSIKTSDATELLLVIDDFPLATKTELALFESLRSASPLKTDQPGMLFHDTEMSLAVGAFSLAYIFQWDARLFVPQLSCEIYSWEGDYIHFWSKGRDLIKTVQMLATEFGFSVSE